MYNRHLHGEYSAWGGGKVIAGVQKETRGFQAGCVMSKVVPWRNISNAQQRNFDSYEYDLQY